jgi:hypothetical protein
MGDADDCWAVDDAIRRLLALQQHATSLVCLVKAGQGGPGGDGWGGRPGPLLGTQSE